VRRLLRAILGRLRYRRRWGSLAAAAAVAADSATAELGRHVRRRENRRGPRSGSPPPRGRRDGPAGT
jgi:hypothetical protein